MRVSIDFSLNTKEGAFGNVSGEIDVLTEPQIGDSISLLFPGCNNSIEPPAGFTGILKVTDRVIAANKNDQPLMIALNDVAVATESDALKLIEYLEAAFDLFSVIY